MNLLRKLLIHYHFLKSRSNRRFSRFALKRFYGLQYREIGCIALNGIL